MLLGEATVYLDENVKWTVMETNQPELIAELKSQVQILRQEEQELKSQVQNLTHNQQMLNEDDEELKSQVQNLTHNQQMLNKEDEELKSQVQNLTHNQLILRQENQELKSHVQNLTHNQQMFNEEDKELKSQVQNLTHNQQMLNKKDEELKSQVQNPTHNQLILRQENQELKSHVHNLTHNQQMFNEEDEELKSQVQNLTHNQQMLNKEDEELKSQVQNLTHNQLILRQENQELKSQVQNLTHNQQMFNEEDEELKSQVQNLAQRMNQLEKGMCVDVRNRGYLSGVYTLYEGNSTITVYCDQGTDGGGWTVFQRRQDGSVDFFRNWADYRHGFGDLNGEFWLGLDNLHILTSSRQYELRVDLEMFNGIREFAHYSGFRVGDVDTDYTLDFDAFLGGNAGDSLTYHKGHGFVTQDHGHSSECARLWHGAWWYDWCYRSDLNGFYNPTAQPLSNGGIFWNSFTGPHVSLKRSEMKIRPM